MQRRRSNWSFVSAVVVLGLIGLNGCSGRPAAVEMIDVDPATAAEEAVKANDANGDGKLSEEELRSIPGVLKQKQLYDADTDGFVTASEIAERIKKWQADGLAFRSISVNVRQNGRPVENAAVRLTPETYLGDAVKPATGTTNARGYASLSVSAEDLPEAIKRRGAKVSGMYPGTYKITLTHPQRKLPEVDAAGLPLGAEVARDTVDSSIEVVLAPAK
jgi:hypothetical protein